MSKNIFDSIWENATPAEKNRLLLLEMNGLVPVIVCVDDDEDALEIFRFNAKSLGIEAFTTTDTGIAWIIYGVGDLKSFTSRKMRN